MVCLQYSSTEYYTQSLLFSLAFHKMLYVALTFKFHTASSTGIVLFDVQDSWYIHIATIKDGSSDISNSESLMSALLSGLVSGKIDHFNITCKTHFREVLLIYITLPARKSDHSFSLYCIFSHHAHLLTTLSCLFFRGNEQCRIFLLYRTTGLSRFFINAVAAIWIGNCSEILRYKLLFGEL